LRTFRDCIELVCVQGDVNPLANTEMPPYLIFS
jgi:hypothetical protein